MKRLTFLVAGIAAWCAFASPGSADTISYAQAAQALVAACGNDVNALCKGVKPGGDRIQGCLAQNAGQVSQQCRQTYQSVFASLAARAKAQAEVPQVCKHDAERHCSNFRAGNARILRCLIRSDNVRKISKKCNQAITNAGWR